MLFAAGFGTRMGAMTKTQPKPMIKVAGRPLVDHALDIVDAAGFTQRVLNLHYLGDQIARHVWGRDVTLSWETGTILDTGGGLRAAIPLLRDSPVMTINTDAVWTGRNPLTELAEAWSDDQMDALLLLASTQKALAFEGPGDFITDVAGRISRANGKPGLAYLGAQIVRTDLLAEFVQSAFSINLLWDRLIERGRVYGLIHSGSWCDVGRPEGIALAEAMLAKSCDD